MKRKPATRRTTGKLGAIDPRDPRPRHVQVEDMLRDIAGRADHARRGKPLPGEVELAATIGVSRSTVRQAMSRLVSEGLLERRRNAGTRVSRKPLVTSLADWQSFTAEMTRRGVTLRSMQVRTVVKPLPAEVAACFDLTARTPALWIARVRGDDDGPVVLFQSWLHPRLKLNARDNFASPLYALIEARSGVTPERSSETIGAVAADAELAASLQCDPGQPILTRHRRVFDRDDRPIEWCNCYYRADRFSYAIELRRQDR